MTFVFGTKRQSQSFTFQKPMLSAENVRFSLAYHVGRNQDGTWSSTQLIQQHEQRPKRKAEGPPMPLTSRRGPRTTALPKVASVSNILEDVSDTIGTETYTSKSLRPDAVMEPRLRLLKRKSGEMDNEELPPAPTDFGTSMPMESILEATPVRSIKRTMTASKTGGFLKYHRSMQEDKPAPCGQPPVWADKRQSLCETLPYYRAYMSGAYMHLQMVRAFMVDKEVGPRDKFEEEIMISRV